MQPHPSCSLPLVPDMAILGQSMGNNSAVAA
jgi:hypothetical protein